MLCAGFARENDREDKGQGCEGMLTALCEGGFKIRPYNPDDKTTYQLDDQEKAAEYG